MTRVNEAIREREIRLIDETGEHVGVIAIDVALRRAAEAELDLVEVSAKSKPHVCRIMDYGQYRYEQTKKQKEAKKKQKQIVVKEIKIRPRIEQHDYEFKLSHAIKFLDHGDKVKFILQFRGRENAHKHLGQVVMDRFIKDLVGFGTVEQEPQTEGRFMNMTIAPVSAAQRKKRKEDSRDGDASADYPDDLDDMNDLEDVDDLEDLDDAEDLGDIEDDSTENDSPEDDGLDKQFVNEE